MYYEKWDIIQIIQKQLLVYNFGYMKEYKYIEIHIFCIFVRKLFMFM